MKFKITYNVCGMHIAAEADNLARAYEYVKAIVTSNKTVYLDQEEMLSETMEVLTQIKRGETIKCSNRVFAVEAVQDEPST